MQDTQREGFALGRNTGLKDFRCALSKEKMPGWTSSLVLMGAAEWLNCERTFKPTVNTITFTHDWELGVIIRIDGRTLIDIAREIELPSATREGASSIAGAYYYFGP